MDGAHGGGGRRVRGQTVPDEDGSPLCRELSPRSRLRRPGPVRAVTPTLLTVGVPRHIARVPSSIDHPAGDQRQAGDGKRDPPKESSASSGLQ